MTNTLYDALFAANTGRGAPFLWDADSHTAISHTEFVTMAARAAEALMDCGLEPGDRVVAQTPKTSEALAIYAGCVQAGLVYLPLNSGYTSREVAYFLSDSGARLMICDPDRLEELGPVAAATGARLLTLGADGTGSMADAMAVASGSFETVPRGADDLAAILYTSGTTGRSKGAMLSHANLLSNSATLRDVWRFTDADVLLHALPIFHTHGLFVATNITLLAGGAMIFLPGFDLDRVIAAVPRASTMMGVPTFYTRLLGDARFSRELTAHMRLFVSGSAPLLAETHVEFEARTGHRILERYGMTETNMNTSNPYDGDRRAGTVGMALPGVEVKVTDPDTGGEVAPGDIGMIEVRGPNVFKGYWQMPEKTAAELRADGFFITGDLGRIDADGYVTIVGRGKDLIISGGYNIYPKEVEAVLDDQPGVLESAVIGVPHPDFGETPVGVLARAPDGEPDPDAILDAAKAELAKFKLPRRLIVVDALPRNTMGKVQKNVLRETYTDLFSDG